LIGLAHRFQVTSHHRWVDKIIRQQLDPASTTCRGPRHWHRADWLRILNFWRANDYFQSQFW
jgi:hypothetical protein